MTMICVTRKNEFNSRGGTGYYKLVVFGFCLLALQPLEASSGEMQNKHSNKSLEYNLYNPQQKLKEKVLNFTISTKRELKKKTGSELKKLIAEGQELFGNTYVAKHKKKDIQKQLCTIHNLLEEVKIREAGDTAIQISKKIEDLREKIVNKETALKFAKNTKRPDKTITALEKQLEYLKKNMIDTRNMLNKVMAKSHNSTPVSPVKEPVSKGLTRKEFIEHINKITGQAPLTHGCLEGLDDEPPCARVVDLQEERKTELRDLINNSEFNIKLKEKQMKIKTAEVLKRMNAMEHCRNSNARKAALAAIKKITADINKIGKAKVKLENKLKSFKAELEKITESS